MAASLTMVLDPGAKQGDQSEASSEALVGDSGGSLMVTSNDLPQGEREITETAPIDESKTEDTVINMDDIPPAAPKSSADIVLDEMPQEGIVGISAVYDEIKQAEMATTRRPQPQGVVIGITAVAEELRQTGVARTQLLLPMKKATPRGSKSTSANALGILAPKKKNKRKSPEASHPSVGISVDALDKDKRWGHGRILEVNVTEQRLKITFPGFSKKWDIWTDMLSIAPHGRYSEQVRLNSKSWDGRTNLFTCERIGRAYGDNCCASPERVETSPKRENEIAPVKPPRRVKKGYVLVPVPEEAGLGLGSAVVKEESPAPKRKLSSPSEETRGNKRSWPLKQERLQSTRGFAVNDPYTNVELGEQRALNESLMERSSAFLAHCAETWKRQLLEMTPPQQAAFLAGDTASSALNGLI